MRDQGPCDWPTLFIQQTTSSTGQWNTWRDSAFGTFEPMVSNARAANFQAGSRFSPETFTNADSIRAFWDEKLCKMTHPTYIEISRRSEVLTLAGPSSRRRLALNCAAIAKWKVANASTSTWVSEVSAGRRKRSHSPENIGVWSVKWRWANSRTSCRFTKGIMRLINKDRSRTPSNSLKTTN